jgi:regulator of replication initiation timing
MKPSNDSGLEQEYADLLAEQAALKRKLSALEDENATLKVRRAELERLAQVAAADANKPTNREGAPLAKEQSDRGDSD